jgi:hypothetical protein
MNSKILLVKNIHLDKEYTNVLSYSESQMLELCSSNLVAQADNYSFIRSTGSIMSGFTYEQCLQANYIAFQNPDYSNKWFFAWIDDVIYKGDKNTEIRFTVDAWSTWFDKWQKKVCYINRQHVLDDTVGLHTVNENLDVGQLICDNTNIVNELGSESFYYFVIASNYNPSNETRYAGVGMYADYPQGSMWFAWLINRENYGDSINEISEWLFNITKQQHADDIQAMFALPYQAFNLTGDIDVSTHLVINGKGKKLNALITKSKSVFRTFNDYSPRNNKLYVYPYSFARITNNLGSYNDYKIEDFLEHDSNGRITDNMIFNVIGVPCIGYSGKIRPKFYQNVDYNEDESLQLGKYPTLSWSVDAFTNWLTQNAVNLTVGAVSNIVGSAISIGVGAASGNALGVASGIVSVSTGIANTFGQLNQASMLPNTAEGNANSGDLSFVFNINRFKILHMRPKKEYLKRIDDYFTRFGYKIDELTTPNITGRKYWNYVEIGSAEEIGYGEVPTKFMNLINNACRKGVTIWHNHENIGNYDLNNSII